MILYCLIIILFLFIFTINEPFTYFNLNLNLNVPISYNNDTDTYGKFKHIKYKYELPKNTETSIFNNRITLKNVANYDYNNKLVNSNKLDNNNCCLVQKEFNNGEFSYKYTPLKNDQCNINLYELNNNNTLLFGKVDCKKTNKILGSCRKANMECIDFITENDCNKVTTEAKGDFFLKFNYKNKNNVSSTKTIWSNKTCNNFLDGI